MSRNKEHRGAAFGGAPNGSVFFVSAHAFYYIMNIPYIFLIYFILICPKYFPYIFLCMFRNLFSQQIYIKLFNRGGL